MRHSLLLFAGLLISTASGCGTGEEAASIPTPTPKLSRRDARIAASRLRHTERRAKAAEAASSPQGRTTSVATGTARRGIGGGRGKSKTQDSNGSTTVTTFGNIGETNGPMVLLEELEGLWAKVEALRSEGHTGDAGFAKAAEALHEFAQWSLEQLDTSAEEASPAAQVRTSAVHYLRAAQCLMKASSDPAGGWQEKAMQQHELALGSVGRMEQERAQ